MTKDDRMASTELLTFRLGEEDYAVHITLVREIRSWTRATPMPHSPAYMKGVVNLRGTVLPVIDLAERLGLPTQSHSGRSVIIVVLIDEEMTGLLVDAVSDIVTVMPDDLQAPPEMTCNATGSKGSVVKNLAMIDDKMTRVLDLNFVIAAPQSAVA